MLAKCLPCLADVGPNLAANVDQNWPMFTQTGTARVLYERCTGSTLVLVWCCTWQRVCTSDRVGPESAKFALAHLVSREAPRPSPPTEPRNRGAPPIRDRSGVDPMSKTSGRPHHCVGSLVGRDSTAPERRPKRALAADFVRFHQLATSREFSPHSTTCNKTINPIAVHQFQRIHQHRERSTTSPIG